MPVEDSSGIETSDILLQPGNETTIHWSPDAIIPPSLQEAFAISNFTVDISLYQLDAASEKKTWIERLGTGIKNLGETIIKLPTLIENKLKDKISSVIVGISISKTFDHPHIADDVFHILAGATIFSPTNYINFLLKPRSLCSIWLHSEPARIGRRIARRLPPCPTNLKKALRDKTFKEEKGWFAELSIKFFHPGADTCFRERNPIRFIAT